MCQPLKKRMLMGVLMFKHVSVNYNNFYVDFNFQLGINQWSHTSQPLNMDTVGIKLPIDMVSKQAVMSREKFYWDGKKWQEFKCRKSLYILSSFMWQLEKSGPLVTSCLVTYKSHPFPLNWHPMIWGRVSMVTGMHQPFLKSTTSYFLSHRVALEQEGGIMIHF